VHDLSDSTIANGGQGNQFDNHPVNTIAPVANNAQCNPFKKKTQQGISFQKAEAFAWVMQVPIVPSALDASAVPPLRLEVSTQHNAMITITGQGGWCG